MTSSQSNQPTPPCKENTFVLQLKLTTIVGLKSFERLHEQDLYIDLALCSATKLDNNSSLRSHMENIIKNNASLKPLLLERMALNIADSILQAYPALRELTLTIKKPQALACAHNAYVTFTYKSSSLSATG